MNSREKEEYLREYEILKKAGQAVLPVRGAEGLGDGGDRRCS